MWLMLLVPLFALAPPARAAEAPCAAPIALGDGWQTADPQASGFDAVALCAMHPVRGAGTASSFSLLAIFATPCPAAYSWCEHFRGAEVL